MARLHENNEPGHGRECKQEYCVAFEHHEEDGASAGLVRPTQWRAVITTSIIREHFKHCPDKKRPPLRKPYGVEVATSLVRSARLGAQ
jgi:hypothetical protein